MWRLLGVVKNEFAKFGEILEKTKDKLDAASKNIDLASSKTRNIQTKLNKVEGLPDNNDLEIALPAAEAAGDES